MHSLSRLPVVRGQNKSPSAGLGRRVAKPRRQAMEMAACSLGSST